MSVTAEVNDMEALTQALGDVRNDGGEGVNRKSWVLVGHVNNNPNQIQLIGQVNRCMHYKYYFQSNKRTI